MSPALAVIAPEFASVGAVTVMELDEPVARTDALLLTVTVPVESIVMVRELPVAWRLVLELTVIAPPVFVSETLPLFAVIPPVVSVPDDTNKL
jgi:hypothetical protein